MVGTRPRSDTRSWALIGLDQLMVSNPYLGTGAHPYRDMLKSAGSSLLDMTRNDYILLSGGKIHAKGVTGEGYYSARNLSAQTADSASTTIESASQQFR